MASLEQPGTKLAGETRRDLAIGTQLLNNVHVYMYVYMHVHLLVLFFFNLF